MVQTLNPFLFYSFIEKISPFGELVGEEALKEQAERDKKKKEYYKTLGSSHLEGEIKAEDQEEEVNLNESYERKIIEYELM